MYAIVDIETTGGHASANGITEVAVVIHDGIQVVHRYQTLVNPHMDIPVYIRALTGITNEMVRSAPSFPGIARELFELLRDKIFVAHNVNFDYSFIKHHLAAAGYQLNCRKLCTVRLGRKIWPGLPSYSLGKFTRQMGIAITDRHRAAGDAEATAVLFAMMLNNDRDGHIRSFLSQGSKEQSLPPHLPKEQVAGLPLTPGVYYFHDSKGKVIYVGKAKSLKKRVCSHFANNSAGRQKQDFLRNIHSVTYQDCGTELMAFILEAVEIKRLWPKFNRAQKTLEHTWGFFVFEDQRGYFRIAIGKRQKYTKPVYTFRNLPDGHNLLRSLVADFNLCPKLCFIQKNNQVCTGIDSGSCKGACQLEELPGDYNLRVKTAMEWLKSASPTFAIVDQGRSMAEQSCILVEEGKFYGMGYVPADEYPREISALKNVLTPYPGNDYIRNLVQHYASRFPERKVSFAL
ncbi:exonuclease domain-containing protein [Hufsiella ginkgonis]|uniref:GIY-YIG nuclease family protein n=1 Tax=Hufsiella ginkgonis TaxID=2695274 RepID=A0A7K1Y1N2_9SPHI|nr:exonuclease domain-containing protein [Hufsiella ginkgonis]MXV17112.1 GIY-YIG nuclease family protein [Hufsiella ginkgonis]